MEGWVEIITWFSLKLAHIDTEKKREEKSKFPSQNTRFAVELREKKNFIGRTAEGNNALKGGFAEV